MDKLLFTKKKLYDGKNIYIWGNDRYSMDIYLQLHFIHENLAGFLVPSNVQKISEFNYVEKENISRDDVVLYDVNSGYLHQLSEVDANKVRFRDFIDFNDNLPHNKNYVIYGNGCQGKIISNLLTEHGYNISGYCNSFLEKGDTDKCGKYNIYSIKDINQCLPNDILVIGSDIYALDMYKMSVEQKVDNIIYKPIYMFFGEEWKQSNLMYTIMLAKRENKRFYIWGASVIEDEIVRLLNRMNIEYQLLDEYDHDNYKNKDCLYYEDVENSFVILAFDKARNVLCHNFLKKIGYDFSKFQCVSMTPLGLINGESRTLQSPLIGYDCIVECKAESGEFFHYISGSAEERKRILILGGSTSADNLYQVRCWGQILAQICDDKSLNVDIYNGAVVGYKSSETFYKLLRDGISLKPDIVIDLTGINDINMDKEKDYSSYIPDIMYEVYNMLGKKVIVDNGVKEEISNYSFWIRNVKLMHYLAQEESIHYFAFFQPLLYFEDVHMPLNQLMCVCVDEMHEFKLRVKQDVLQYDFIFDYSELLKDVKNAFFDNMHYTESANKIIAEHIFNQIEKYLL